MKQYRLPRSLSEWMVYELQSILNYRSLGPSWFIHSLNNESFLRCIPRIFHYRLGIAVWSYTFNPNIQTCWRFGKLFRMRRNTFLIPIDNYIYNSLVYVCPTFKDESERHYSISYDETLVELFQILHNFYIDIPNIMIAAIQNSYSTFNLYENVLEESIYDNRIKSFITEARTLLSEL